MFMGGELENSDFKDAGPVPKERKLFRGFGESFFGDTRLLQG